MLLLQIPSTDEPCKRLLDWARTIHPLDSREYNPFHFDRSILREHQLTTATFHCTQWDAVWNGVAQWMGVHDDADLDWALPNRIKFDRCADLFHDTDLFDDGACTCAECADLTPHPTGQPTPQVRDIVFCILLYF